MPQQLRPLLGERALDELAPRDDEVAALVGDLDDLELEGLTDVGLELLDRGDLDLRAGEERLDVVDLHDEAAADRALDGAGDDASLDVAVEDLLPADLLVGAALGELDHARLVVLELHDHHRRLVADLRIGAFAELRERHRASGLVADVDEHVVALERRDGPLDHRTGLELRLIHRGREHLRHRGALRLGRRGFPDCHNTFLYFWVCL